MNHTHYALINAEGDIVAVLLRDGWESRFWRAVEEETGDKVVQFAVQETDYCNYEVTATTSMGEYKAIIRPTWEY